MEITGIGNTWLPDNTEDVQVKVEQSLLSLGDCSRSHVIVSNTTGYTLTLEPHTKLGTTVQCNDVKPTPHVDDKQASKVPPIVRMVVFMNLE